MVTPFPKNVSATCDFTVGQIITSVKSMNHANMTHWWPSPSVEQNNAALTKLQDIGKLNLMKETNP